MSINPELNRDANPVIRILGRRLRLAVIGGGPGSFIGAMHRTAARLDDRFEIVGAALSSNPARSQQAASDLGLPADRACLITGLEVAEIAAEVGTIVPGRLVHDYAGALPRFSGGARGSFWVTQAAAGVENGLRIRVSGTLGSIEWWQEQPNLLNYLPLDGPAQVRTRNGPGTLPLSARAARIVKGHPEGFHEGFANIDSDAAEAIANRRAGKTVDPLAQHFPNVVDGARGVKFVHAAIQSSEDGGTWTDCRFNP